MAIFTLFKVVIVLKQLYKVAKGQTLMVWLWDILLPKTEWSCHHSVSFFAVKCRKMCATGANPFLKRQRRNFRKIRKTTTPIITVGCQSILLVSKQIMKVIFQRKVADVFDSKENLIQWILLPLLGDGCRTCEMRKTNMLMCPKTKDSISSDFQICP